MTEKKYKVTLTEDDKQILHEIINRNAWSDIPPSLKTFYERKGMSDPTAG
jgi:hypothetical protein